MKKISLSLAILCGLFFIVSCGNKKGPTIKVDNFSNGKAGEIILIMDHNIWPDTLRNEVKNVLTQPQPAINQIEPMFDILDFQNKDFSSNFQRHRSIVRFDINPDYSGNTFNIENNVWSSPQVYVYIKGNNINDALRLFMDNQERIINVLYDNDLKRLQTTYSRDVDANTEKLIREKFGIFLSVPSQYFVASDEPDFLWLRFRTMRNDRFIMIYKTPMTEITAEKLMDTRDSITKKYIPGAVQGAYPILARKLGYPIIDQTRIGNKQGMEMRGLWESVNDKMGGPFYSFSFLDPSGQNCITVDGFVYAPQEDKRDYIREVEAIVKSIR